MEGGEVDLGCSGSAMGCQSLRIEGDGKVIMDKA
jgi:hypothetical protein